MGEVRGDPDAEGRGDARCPQAVWVGAVWVRVGDREEGPEIGGQQGPSDDKGGTTSALRAEAPSPHERGAQKTPYFPCRDRESKEVGPAHVPEAGTSRQAVEPRTISGYPGRTMLSNMRPYTPSLYQGDGIARYRQYPRNVNTPVPGAGYDVEQLVWAEQELNLDGSGHPQDYGSYRRVPLRGLGATAPGLFTGIDTAQERLAVYERMPQSMKDQISDDVVDKMRAEARAEAAMQTKWDAGSGPKSFASEHERSTSAADMRRRAESYTAPAVSDDSFFDKKLGPVPLWAALAGGAAVLGGGALMMFRKK